MEENSSRIHLKGWEHEMNTIEITPDGTLVTEKCKFSTDERDEAWGIKIAKETHPQLLTHLLQDPMFQTQICHGSPEDQLRQLLPLFAERFRCHYDFKSWVEERGIPFTSYIAPFA